LGKYTTHKKTKKRVWGGGGGEQKGGDHKKKVKDPRREGDERFQRFHLEGAGF